MRDNLLQLRKNLLFALSNIQQATFVVTEALINGQDLTADEVKQIQADLNAARPPLDAAYRLL